MQKLQKTHQSNPGDATIDSHVPRIIPNKIDKLHNIQDGLRIKTKTKLIVDCFKITTYFLIILNILSKKIHPKWSKKHKSTQPSTKFWKKKNSFTEKLRECLTAVVRIPLMIGLIICAMIYLKNLSSRSSARLFAL